MKGVMAAGGTTAERESDWSNGRRCERILASSCRSLASGMVASLLNQPNDATSTKEHRCSEFEIERRKESSLKIWEGSCGGKNLSLGLYIGRDSFHLRNTFTLFKLGRSYWLPSKKTQRYSWETMSRWNLRQHCPRAGRWLWGMFRMITSRISSGRLFSKIVILLKLWICQWINSLGMRECS